MPSYARTIDYYRKKVYGAERLYIVDAQDAKFWEMISGKKTVTEQDMQRMTYLTGVEWNEVG
jgi:hypothetical protein